MPDQPRKTVIISGGTSGMGRAVALDQVARGNNVTVIGSNEAKGRALLNQAADPNLQLLRADLSSIDEVERVVAHVSEQHQAVDALALFANRISPKRKETPDGLESTFALYYLSRYLLGRWLRPLLDAAPNPVIINVAGVGNTAGQIFWDDPQLTSRYSQVRAQLQAGRANDLLEVAFAGRVESKARYVLYHPGFTRSGANAHPSPVVQNMIKLLARFFARPVDDSVRPTTCRPAARDRPRQARRPLSEDLEPRRCRTSRRLHGGPAAQPQHEASLILVAATPQRSTVVS